jgi:hypothetical protein
MSEDEPTIANVLAAVSHPRTDMGQLCVDMMARMDRLQDTAIQQGRDLNVLLELMSAQQSGVRSAQEAGASHGSVLVDLVKRMRQVEADIRELREKH